MHTCKTCVQDPKPPPVNADTYKPTETVPMYMRTHEHTRTRRHACPHRKAKKERVKETPKMPHASVRAKRRMKKNSDARHPQIPYAPAYTCNAEVKKATKSHQSRRGTPQHTIYFRMHALYRRVKMN